MKKLFVEMVRYAGVSAVAFAVDISCLLLLAEHVHYLLAASIGFLTGGIVAHQLAIRFVFLTRRLSNATTELGYFVVLGIAGLAVNSVVMYLTVTIGGIPLVPAKIIAAGCTFSVNFLLRRQLLFVTHNLSPNPIS